MAISINMNRLIFCSLSSLKYLNIQHIQKGITFWLEVQWNNYTTFLIVIVVLLK